MNDQPLFGLTQMTGKEASDQRSAVIGPVEGPRRPMIIGVIAFVAGLVPTAFAFMIVGPLGILLLPLLIGGAIWMFHGRSSKGLEIRHYQELLNRQQAVLNEFMLGSAVISVPHDDWAMIEPGSMPNPALHVRPEDMPATESSTLASVSAIFDSPTANKITGKGSKPEKLINQGSINQTPDKKLIKKSDSRKFSRAK